MPGCDHSGPAQEEKDVQALIVDNNADDCAKVVEDLHRAGYEAVAVASVREARQALADHPFDLLLLELKLPDGDGLQFCNELRERLGDGMVIIFVTETNSPASRVVGIELGADDFMGKPCDAEELLARIDARMRWRSAIRH
jgi:DNA-binding response OmpR family regulator